MDHSIAVIRHGCASNLYHFNRIHMFSLGRTFIVDALVGLDIFGEI